jgi:hypothetical protein
MTIGVGTGCTISFGEGGYEGEAVGVSLDGEEVVVIDVTTLATTSYRKKISGSLIEPPAFTVEILYDFDNPPPINTTATALFTFPDTSELEGTGFFVSQSAEVALEDVMKGTYVFQFDGDSGPTYTPPA